MNEYEIECRVERATDRLDRAFMKGNISQAEYDREISILDKWAQQQYEAGKVLGMTGDGQTVRALPDGTLTI